MKYAQTTKIASQKIGSTFDGIRNTVAIPIARPNSDSLKIRRVSRLISTGKYPRCDGAASLGGPAAEASSLSLHGSIVEVHPPVFHRAPVAQRCLVAVPREVLEPEH